ncbi:MAG: DUF427 domain-containing protein [Dehalococcoidia bacterium]|nr:MAG: DUF427 domain-containing protein [Dehalococcoidia bacterium]
MLQKKITDEGKEIIFEPNPKWVRVIFNGEVIADSKNVHLLRTGGPPYYFFPKEDVRMNLLVSTDHIHHSTTIGDAQYFTVMVGDQATEHAAWLYPKPISDNFNLTGYIAFVWDKMDAWFEEAEQVYVHPHDPHKRIDILQSTRHVVVVVVGEQIAETHHPVLLYETGLPTRYYLPKLDVRMELLVPSERITGCAYKGKAQYYSVKVGDRIIPDIAWYYTYPTIEASKISGMICFFNERVDNLIIDGVAQPKLKTPWS